MQTMYKTDRGTLSATRYEDGIYFGILKQGSIGAIKPGDDGGLTLVINDEIVERYGFEIEHVRETEGWGK